MYLVEVTQIEKPSADSISPISAVAPVAGSGQDLRVVTNPDLSLVPFLHELLLCSAVNSFLGSLASLS
jgi:hypothetical protein